MTLKEALDKCKMATWFMVLHNLHGRTVHDVFLDESTKKDIIDMFGESVKVKSMVPFGSDPIDVAQSIKIVL